MKAALLWALWALSTALSVADGAAHDAAVDAAQEAAVGAAFPRDADYSEAVRARGRA